MTNKNEQEKKKSYIAPAMEVIEFDRRQALLLGSKENSDESMKMIIN